MTDASRSSIGAPPEWLIFEGRAYRLSEQFPAEPPWMHVNRAAKPWEAVGFRVHWDHINGRDKNAGCVWPDRETAEDVADTLRESEWVQNVRVVTVHG